MPLRLELRGTWWWIRGTVRGPRGKRTYIRETTGIPEAQRDAAETVRAQREAELLEELVYGKLSTVSLRRCADSYLKAEPRSERTKKLVKQLVDFLGGRAAGAIDRVAADEAVDHILDKDASPATKRRVVYGPLTAILNHGADKKWCPPPSFGRLPAVGDSNTAWLTPAQAVALIDHAAPHLKPLLRFLLCTGARMSEALDLDWADVDLTAAKVVFRKTKGRRGQKKDRPARLPPRAVADLAILPHREGKVFRRDDGEPYTDRKRAEGGQIGTGFTSAARRAGLPGTVTEVERKVRTRWRKRYVKAWRPADGYAEKVTHKLVKVWTCNFRPHDLRHTWASWGYAVCRDPMLLKDEGGWSGLDMVERYAHLMPTDMVPDIALIWGPSHPRFGLLPIRTNLVQKPTTSAISA